MNYKEINYYRRSFVRLLKFSQCQFPLFFCDIDELVDWYNSPLKVEKGFQTFFLFTIHLIRNCHLS